jgi:hypothetical protein
MEAKIITCPVCGRNSAIDTGPDTKCDMCLMDIWWRKQLDEKYKENTIAWVRIRELEEALKECVALFLKTHPRKCTCTKNGNWNELCAHCQIAATTENARDVLLRLKEGV